MPTLNDIQQTILNKKNTSQDEVRRDYLKKLSDYTDRDVIVYASAFATTKAAIIPALLLSLVIDDMQ